MEDYSDTHKRRMRAILTRDVKWGYVTPPNACEECGVEGPLEHHHDGYETPNDARWLCVECHVRVENEIRKTRAYTNEDAKGGG